MLLFIKLYFAFGSGNILRDLTFYGDKEPGTHVATTSQAVLFMGHPRKHLGVVRGTSYTADHTSL